MLTNAAALEWNNRKEDAVHEADRIQRQWPEWSQVWYVRGIIHARHRQFQTTLTTLESAATLGAPGAGADDSRYLNHLFDGSLALAGRESQL